MKKVLAISDLHCGHKVGLTPPSKFAPKSTDEGKLHRALWNTFEWSIDGYKKCDVLLLLGDAIDGPGKKAGGREQITTDPSEQCDYAIEILKYINPKSIAMVAGTPYHTGQDTDNEAWIAKTLGAKFGGVLFVEIDGVIFNLKHKIGSSEMQHLRHTPLAKARVQARLWEQREQIPEASIYLRGHVHYHVFDGASDWLGMTLPALQGLGSIYGERECSGLVDFGATRFQIEKGTYQWGTRIRTVKEQRAELISLG